MIHGERYMRRCLEIGKLALGTARPNPNVGCVIVHDQSIIAEGYTSPFGGAHAEVNAIDSIGDFSLLNNSTLYVSLEPCSHYGKTPPCANRIIEAGIKHVVVGCMDPNPEVSGQGIALLRNAGCQVETGVLEDECREHHRRFLTFHEARRPYIILKWAESKDGFLAPAERDKIEPVWISNTNSRQLVHKWRAEEQAILVGYNTVKQDNPSLTVRDWTGDNPKKVVIDRYGTLVKDYDVFKGDPPLIITEKDIDFSKGIASQIVTFLYHQNINSIIIEGGTKTLNAFLFENIWDEARVFSGQLELTNGIKAPLIENRPFIKQKIGTDVLKIYKNA